MIWLIVVPTVGAWVLAAAGIMPFWGAMIITLGAVFLGAWNLDRTGRGGRKVRDQNRPDFYGPTDNSWTQIATAYVERQTSKIGTDPPPGVEHDEAGVRRDPGRR